jgi:hypothetical protein
MTPVNGYIVYLPCGPEARPPSPSKQEPPPVGGFPRLIEFVTEGFYGEVESGTTYSAGSGGNTMTSAQLDPGTFGGWLEIAETLPSVLGGTYKFSFWNVSGGYNASDDYPVGQTSFDRLVPPAPVIVGDEPITVLLVYATTCTSGVTIGAFDETTGSLFYAPFIKTVSPDPDGKLLLNANNDGFVDTTGSAETITALDLTSNGLTFEQWVDLNTLQITSQEAFPKVSQGASALALAFYRRVPSISFNIPRLGPSRWPTSIIYLPGGRTIVIDGNTGKVQIFNETGLPI